MDPATRFAYPHEFLRPAQPTAHLQSRAALVLEPNCRGGLMSATSALDCLFQAQEWSICARTAAQ